MAERPVWKGVLQIARVQIPIKVYPATSEAEKISLNQLHENDSLGHPCYARIKQQIHCPACQREVDHAELVKGYEYEPGKYAPLSKDELEAIKPPSTLVIDVTQIANAVTLERRVGDRAYFLVPNGAENGPASHAYAVICAALRGLVGIGKLAIYGREYLVAVEAQGPGLMLYTLHHAAELRTAPAVAPRVILSTNPEFRQARRLFAAMLGPLDLADFIDQYQADLRRLIDAKIAGEEIVVPPLPEPAPIATLRDALEQSLAAVAATKPIPATAGLSRTRTGLKRKSA